LIAIPISASEGDNVVSRSVRMPFYDRESLLQRLESLTPGESSLRSPFRFAVQWIVRSMDASGPGTRGYAGRVSAGRLRVGDRLRILPNDGTAIVSSLESSGQAVQAVANGESVVIRLDREIDVSRGDSFVRDDEPQPLIGRKIEADLVWFGRHAARLGATYRLKHLTRTQRASVQSIAWRLDVGSLAQAEARTLVMNDIARVEILLSAPIAWDTYDENRTTGSAILIDEQSGDTVAGAMFRHVVDAGRR
jgi:sulfate adenylyltransferase subunit 1